MTRKQFTKLKMYAAVDSVLTLFNTIVSTLPALAAYQTELQGYITTLLTNAEIQDTADTGVAIDKEAKRETLCRSATNMAAQVRSWAENTGNTLLAEQVRFTFSECNKLKDAMVAERCQTIHDTANINLAALANYGVTAATLTALQTLIDAFEDSNTGPRDAEVAVKAATIAVEETIKLTDTLLKNRMDGLVKTFADTEPTFYNQYFEARVIQDAGTSFTRLTGIIKDIATSTGLEGVKIEVVGKAYNTLSKADGGYELRITVPGTYTIKFTKSGYADKTFSGIVIKLGEETKLDAGMEGS